MSGDEFEQLATTRCGRWSSRSLVAARRVLVDSAKPVDVATELGMKPQQVYVLRDRFLARTSIKVSLVEYMEVVEPDRALRLAPFKTEVRVLLKRGYSAQQIADFLRANDITTSLREIKELYKGAK